MHLRWIAEKDEIYRRGLDAYADWISETGTPVDAAIWRPFVLRVPPVRNRAATFLNAIGTAITQDNAAEARFNAHDLFHWVFSALQDRTEATELVVLERGDGGGEALEHLTELLNAGLEPPQEDGHFEVLLGHSSTLPAALSANDHTTEILRTAAVYLADLEAAEAQKTASSRNRTTQSKEPPLVVTAVIDHAIPFLHERFRSGPLRTRIAACWRQGAAHPAPDAPFNGDPEPAMGHQVTSHWINSALQALRNGEITSEQDIYNAGSFRGYDGTAAARGRGGVPLALSSTHGGQMLDLAAGAAQGSELAEQNAILAVELPAALVAQTNGFLHEPYVKSALNWVWFQLTFNPGLQRPARSVVVNYSFGDFAGRRDGQAVLDADFQRRLARKEMDVLNVPAGNSYLSDCHARLDQEDIARGEVLELWVQPDTKTQGFVQIWLNEAYETLPFDLRITPPSGPQSPAAEVGQSLDLLSDDTVARVYVQTKEPRYPLPSGMTPMPRTCITLALRPTACHAPVTCTAPAGRWRLSFGQNLEPMAADEVIEIYVERNDSVIGFPVMGRQAYLDHPNHRRLSPNAGPADQTLVTASPIKRTGTTGANTNGRDVFVAAAARSACGAAHPAPYSSAGTQQRALGMPTASFIAEDSQARRNTTAAGTLSSVSSYAGGTSAATALATRTAVETLLANPDQIGSSTARDHVKAAFEGGTYPAAPAAPPQELRRGAAIVAPVARDRPARFES